MRLLLVGGSLLLGSLGCRSTPPVPVHLSELSAAIASQKIEVSGTVRDLRFEGNASGFLQFFLCEGDREIRCVAAGYNELVLREAAILVEEAATSNEPVTVTGIYRVGPHRELLEGDRLEIQTIRARGQRINTEYDAGYPPYPIWWGWYFGPRYPW